MAGADEPVEPLPAAPWGLGTIAVANVAALAVHFGLLISIPVVAEAFGYGRSFRDAGDIFTSMTMAAEYTAERLQAAARGVPLPSPPQLRGDTGTARIAYLAAIVDLVAIAAIAMVASRRGARQFLRDLGLHRSPLRDISTPVIAAGATIAGLVAYGLAVDALGLEFFETGDPAPATVLRDNLALALFAVVTLVLAPVAEEVLFRGLVFGGLLQFGLLPAMAGSSLLFAAWHLSLALLPLLGVGAVLSWLYHRSASLWQPITFHAIFNTVAFVQFAGGR